MLTCTDTFYRSRTKFEKTSRRRNIVVPLKKRRSRKNAYDPTGKNLEIRTALIIKITGEKIE